MTFSGEFRGPMGSHGAPAHGVAHLADATARRITAHDDHGHGDAPHESPES